MFLGGLRSYSMLWMDELLGQLGEAQCITTLDLTKGYWNIPLSLDSRKKTASPTPLGLIHFKTMLFGLQGAVAPFSMFGGPITPTT